MASPETPSTEPDTPLDILTANWGWLLALGVALILLGVLALAEATLVTLGAVAVFGILLMVGGIAQAAHAFTERGSGMIAEFLLAVLYFVAGLAVAVHPLRGAIVITLLIAASLIFNGSLRIVLALKYRRYATWPLMLLCGMVTVLVGCLILSGWPDVSLFILGLFIGIELLTNGIGWVMLALAARSVPS